MDPWRVNSESIIADTFNANSKTWDSRHKMSRLPNSNHIVQFFLDLYRRQIGISDMDTCTMSASRLNKINKSDGITYELKVTYKGRERIRRMSLCRLGEDMQSRSTCYKVIYDDLLVLKIPPEPITDFRRYLKSIELERAIAARLGPEVTCISPSLSAILDKSPEFKNERGLNKEAWEEEIAVKLKQSPDLQRNLKVGGTFVLFMGLSKDLFFDQVITRMHQNETRLRDAISQSCDSLADIPAFENSFGRGKEALFISLSNLQQSYVLAMDQLLLKHGRESHEIPDDQKKQWMFDQLAGKAMTGEHGNLPPGFVHDQHRVGKEVLLHQKNDIREFIDLIKSDIRETAETRNRAIAGGILSNLVKLLCHLKEKRTAIRDMKPDNMFLVGDADDPDLLIASADRYSLGLIDLETSVSAKETEVPRQPILAGTPSFATPSHLFENAVLMHVFQDVPRTFYLQDWFAAIGLIYHVVTGKTLFEKTGKLLSEVARVRSKACIKDDPLDGVLENASWVFWSAACAEFKEMMDSNHLVFEGISFSLDRTKRQMFVKEILSRLRFLSARIERYVSQQTFFQSEKTRKNILSAGSKKIEATLKKWEVEKDLRKMPPKTHSGVMDFLACIAHLKKCGEKLRQLRPILESQTSEINAWQFILLLFRLVFSFMYRPEWSDRRHPECL